MVQPDRSVVSTSPALSEISERDKPWDKHRANTDTATSHYRDTEFDKYATRMTFCSELLDFKLIPDQPSGELKLKLSSARFCRVRHCPVCQWRRSLMWKAKAYKILPIVVSKYPHFRWLFLTLTQKNCPITELRENLTLMNKAWQRLSQRKKFPAVGWIRSTEVTRGKDGSAHPHFHCLLLVPSNYFSGKGYIKQDEWCELWRKSLKVDYKPILDVQAIKQGKQPMQLVPELLKYCVKESDLVADQHWFLELTRQMHRVRCVATGGVLKGYLKALEEEPEDLIGESDEDEVDEGHLRFGWKLKEKKYRMVD
ncbi:replication protein [Synechococcus moorigangaii CMS01]|nr:replication protein [Synechococcus moorigangaii CMS01]